MSDVLLKSLNDGVLELCLNRPDKKNALTVEMYSALAAAIDDANANSEKVAAAQVTDDVAQAVMPAMATTLLDTIGARR